MKTVKKKIHPEYFKSVLSGKKNFEFRVADFDIKEGNTLILEEWDLKTKKYTGRSIEKKISFLVKLDLDSFDQRKLLEKYGFYILSLK